MKLFLHVIEARGLVAMDLNRLSDPYVRLKLGKQRAKTKVVKKSLKPWWDEEFYFRVGDLGKELTVSVIDEDKCFNDDFIGQVKVPLSKVFDSENHSLGTAWYRLQPKSKKKATNRECGNDHGVKAQGDGWLLTIALIKGVNFAAVDSCGYSDPYVVFTCNGKTKTSSNKFQDLDPHWNEIFEFDAMNDSPSIMDIKVYDFDGPFDEAVSLGHAEVNFVKSNLSELADVWISLKGNLAQACQSKLHLRIFLNNT